MDTRTSSVMLALVIVILVCMAILIGTYATDLIEAHWRVKE
jgi:hypothetical protein